MERAAKLLHAQDAWKVGIFGRGITAAVLDTGLAPHPDFENRILCFKDMLYGKKEPYDDYGHGTHVTGILAGGGKIRPSCMGIAPGCLVVHVKVLDQNGNGRREAVIKGIDWVIANRKRYKIRILNISVGTVKEGDRQDAVLVRKVEEAWNAGIVVVVAAGNMGPKSASITAPGNSPKVITVGSFDEMGPLYSGRGPTRECVCKPDLVAPGSEILSCSSGFDKKKGYYCRKSGTSMATPMVSGAVALLLEKEPYLTNVEVKMRLKESARDLGMEKNRQGWGMPDISVLLNL